MAKAIIEVYLDNGVVFEYEVDKKYICAKVREHHHAIITKGYRHDSGGVYESYPVHRIEKVKTKGFQGTTYVDKVRGT